MKKYIILLFVAAFAFSCSKPENLEPVAPISEDEISLEVDFTVTDGTPDVKGIKKAWANNEVIYIFFNNEIQCKVNDRYFYNYLKIKYNRTQDKWLVDSWEGIAKSRVAATTSGKFSAFYTPLSHIGGNLDVVNTNNRFDYFTADHRYFNGLYLIAENVNYTIADGKMTATINLVPKAEDMVQFFMEPKHRDGTNINPNNAPYTDITRYLLQIDLCADYLSSTHFVYSGHIYGLMDDGTFGFMQGSEYGSNYLKPYYYGGLCYACPRFKAQYDRIEFILHDTGTGKKYSYIYQLSSASSWNNNTYYSAFKLPALNAKDSSNAYYWKEQ